MERKGYVGPPKADLIDAHMVTRVADDAHIPIFKVGRVNVRQCGSSVARCEGGFLILASFLYFLLRQCALYFVEKIHHYILLSLLFTTSTTTTTTIYYYYYYIPRLLSSSPCWSSSFSRGAQFWLKICNFRVHSAFLFGPQRDLKQCRRINGMPKVIIGLNTDQGGELFAENAN